MDNNLEKFIFDYWNENGLVVDKTFITLFGFKSHESWSTDMVILSAKWLEKNKMRISDFSNYLKEKTFYMDARIAHPRHLLHEHRPERIIDTSEIRISYKVHLSPHTVYFSETKDLRCNVVIQFHRASYIFLPEYCVDSRSAKEIFHHINRRIKQEVLQEYIGNKKDIYDQNFRFMENLQDFLFFKIDWKNNLNCVVQNKPYLTTHLRPDGEFISSIKHEISENRYKKFDIF